MATQAESLEPIQNGCGGIRGTDGPCSRSLVFRARLLPEIRAGQWGSLQGSFDGSFMDCVYFSFTTYTTIGFGDISPLGDLKYLTGLQALTGLVLISWTASFLFVEMQKYWKIK